jgi:two-component system sensor histidine kinase KdpD
MATAPTDLLTERTAKLEETLEQLRRANAEKDEFLGLVSHELRTPLTIVLGNARVLATSDPTVSEEDKKGAIQDIVQAGERLQRLIENLTVLTRLDSAGESQMEPILLQRLLPKLLDELAARTPDRRIQVHLPPGLPPIRATVVHVEQIIANLVANAVKYSPPSLPIELSARQGKRSVAVTVRHYGSNEQKKAGARLGLNLAVSQRLVAAQGGRIWMERSVEDGAAFSFNLRIWEADTSA